MAALDELLDAMQDMVQEARTVPLTQDKCIIERERMLEMLDELRTSLPADLKMAADIVEKRNEMLDNSRREADLLMKQAEDKVRKMVSDTEVMTAARKKAKEVLGNAEIQARELRRAANEYCEDSLKRSEEGLALAASEVKKARERFRSVK